MKKYSDIGGFPNEFCDPQEKETEDYGLRVANAIFAQTNDSVFSGNFKERVNRFYLNEKLVQGLQGANQYKPMMGDHEGTTQFMHLFWKETNPLNKYKNIAVELLTENRFKPICTSYDSLSQTEKDTKLAKLIGNMRLKELEENELKGTGIKLVPKGEQIPKSEEEVELYGEMTFKSSLEMAMEVAISCVLGNNEFEDVRFNTAKSLVTNQWGARHHTYDENNDIVIEHIPEERLIVPYSRDDKFKKRKWTGHITQMTVSELRVWNTKNGGQIFSDNELFQLAKNYTNHNGNGNFNRTWVMHDHEQRWNNFLVDVLSFEYNTTIPKKWTVKNRKNGGKIVRKVDYDKNEGVNSKSKELISKQRQVYFDGLWVIGSSKMLNWELRPNMAFSNGTGLGDGKPLSRYVICAPGIYEMRNKALPEKAEMFVHQMHLAILKFQHILTEIAPPETAVDVKALSGVMEGLGLKNGKPADVMKMRKQLGVWFYRSQTSNGKVLNQNPIKEINHQYSGVIAEIVNIYNQNLRLLQDEIGLNEVIAGTSQNQYEGLQSRQLKVAAGLKSISDLNNAMEYMDKQSAMIIGRMVQDTISRGDKIEGFERAIGKVNVDIIKIQGTIGMAEMGIDVEFLPTERQLERLDEELIWNQRQDLIRWEDAEMVRQLAPVNLKRAIRFMALKREQYRQEKMQEQQMLMQQNAQGNQQAVQLQKQMEAQEQALEHERKKELQVMQGMQELTQDEEKHKDKLREIDRKERHEKEKIRIANQNNLDTTTSGSSQMRQPEAFTQFNR